MMENIQFSQGCIDDAADFAAIYAEAFDQMLSVTAWNKDEISKMLGRSTIGSWLLKDGGQIVCFIMYQIQLDEAEILTFATRPRHQGKGYGEYLLRKSLAEINRMGVSLCTLEVKQRNNPAIYLYSKLGFSKISTRKSYYHTKSGRLDAEIMQKEL